MKYSKRIMLLLAVDSFIVLCSVFISYLLRFEARIPEPFWDSMPYAMGGFGWSPAPCFIFPICIVGYGSMRA